MIRKIQSFSSLKKFPVKNAIKKSLLTVEVAGAALIAPLSAKYSETAEKLVVNIGDKYIAEKQICDTGIIQKQMAKINRVMMLRTSKQMRLKRQGALILQIMNEDKNCCISVNKEKLAANIVKWSNEYGADPVHIACIVKKESHFTENLNKSSGKGLMQLTQIAVKDMYVRPNLYHPGLKEIKEKYPAYEDLFAAIQTDSELNLRVGIISFIQRLETAKGNIKTALRNYNGSSRKESYARDVFNNIQKYSAVYKNCQMIQNNLYTVVL